MSKRALLTACAGLPACLVAAVGLWSIVANHSGGWVWPPDTVTMPEAVATGNYAELVRQLERGISPDLPAEVRAALLADPPVRVTPLQAAVWARNPLMVKILMDRGAAISSTELTVLKCMNDEHGNREVRELLDALPAAPAPSCDDVTLPR